MSDVGAPRHDPIPIGEIAAPPFAIRPDPESLFQRRSNRFRTVAEGHPLKPFLLFLADLSSAQHFVQVELPAVAPPDPETLARAGRHGMPPLERRRFTPDAACDLTLDRLLALLAGVHMPAEGRTALRRLTDADPAIRIAMMQAVLADAVSIEALASHVIVAAALQVHFARLAAALDPATLRPVADGACPSCGAPPVSSLVVDWPGAHGSRFCTCSLCATMWNTVRIKCTICGSTKGIGYQHVDGGPETIKAETCSECGHYVKIFYQLKDPALDPVADDVASLGLDMLVREGGLVRGGVNVFMIGS